MTSQDQIISALELALGVGETSVIVRSSGAIAEVHGLLTVRRKTEWVTLGEEGQTHIHLKIVERCRLRYRRQSDKNAALELAGPDGEVLCRVAFHGTNQTKTDQYQPERAAMIHESFSHLTESGET